MPTATSRDGCQIWYQDTMAEGSPASDKALLLIHGFGSGSSLWRSQIPVLTAAGYRCVSYDMRGHARSESPDDPGRYSKLSQVEDMKAVLVACGIRSATFVAHSMGGMDALLCYLKYPELVSGLVLYGTGPGFTKDKGRQGWNKTAAKLADKYRARGLAALVGSDATKGHTSALGLEYSCRGNYTQRDDDPLLVELADVGGPFAAARCLGAVSIPCSIIVGERDRAFLGASHMMAKKIPGATLDVISGAGHMACERNADEFNAVLLRRLDAHHVTASKL